MVDVTDYDVDGARVIEVYGTLDAPSTMAIEEGFRSMLEGETLPVILDLGGVDFVSSYGLRMLLTTAQLLHETGAGLHLCSPNEHVMRTLIVAGYDSMFSVYETRDHAIDALT